MKKTRTNEEMRAWLEEKREELMLPVKLSGYPPTKWHIERNEIIDSILAALAEPSEEERKEMPERDSIKLTRGEVSKLEEKFFMGESCARESEFIDWLYEYGFRIVGILEPKVTGWGKCQECDGRGWNWKSHGKDKLTKEKCVSCQQIPVLILGYVAQKGEKEEDNERK